MDLVKCPACGAPRDDNSYKCDFCGSVFRGRADKRAPTKLSKDNVVKIANYLRQNNAKNGILGIAVFMFFWFTMLTLMIVIMLINGFFFPVVFPLLFMAVGGVVLGGSIRMARKENINHILDLCEKKDFDKAFSLAKVHNSKLALLLTILLAYHIFNDEEYLRENCVLADRSLLNRISNYTPEFEKIVRIYM